MSTSRLPRSYPGLRRWLHSGASDLVLIVPARPDRKPSPLGLQAGLPRWQRRIDHWRVAALLRRWLLLGLSLAIVLELLAATVGDPARWLWLALPLALACGGILAGLSRPVGSVETALLLDRQLGLSERLTTALELAPSEAGSNSLGALLQSEADTAIDESLAHSRASDPSAIREWLSVLVAALLLIGALALGAGSSAHSQPTTGVRGAGANAAGGTAAGKTVPKTAGSPSSTPAAHPQTAQAHPSASSSGAHRSTGHATQPTRSATGQGHAATGSTSPGPTSQTAHSTNSISGSSSHSSAGAGRSTAIPPSPSTDSSPTGTSPHTASQGTSSTSSQATSKVAAGLHGAGPARPGSSTSATTHARSRAGTAGAAGSPSASSGAGATPGHTTTPSNRTTSTKTGSTEALPIQSGYTAGHASHASSAPADGENTNGTKTGQSQGEPAVGGAGSGGASFAFIPLDNGGLPPFDTNLLFSYFAPFPSLSGLTW